MTSVESMVIKMLEKQSDHIMIVAQKVDATNREVGELKTRLDLFSAEVIRHFATCPVDDLREQTGALNLEIERLKPRHSKTPPSTPVKIEGSDHTGMALKIAMGAIMLASAIVAIWKVSGQ
jgi:uncharacterized small protein (DUF1192 family)